MNDAESDGLHYAAYQRPGSAPVDTGRPADARRTAERMPPAVAPPADARPAPTARDADDDSEGLEPQGNEPGSIRMHGEAAPPAEPVPGARRSRPLPNPFLVALWVVCAIFAAAAVWTTRELESGYAAMYFGLEPIGLALDEAETQQRMARLQYLPSITTALITAAALAMTAALTVHAFRWRRNPAEPGSA
jgi:hypothetical protein